MTDFSEISQNGKKATRACRCGHLDDAIAQGTDSPAIRTRLLEAESEKARPAPRPPQSYAP